MQGNRNPFIDNPYLATKIWGGTAAEETWGLLGIEDNALISMKVYPTVVSERLYVSNTTGKDLDIAVYNIIGQEININMENDYIEVHSLSKGVYFLKVDHNSSTKAFKFIKH